MAVFLGQMYNYVDSLDKKKTTNIYQDNREVQRNELCLREIKQFCLHSLAGRHQTFCHLPGNEKVSALWEIFDIVA